MVNRTMDSFERFRVSSAWSVVEVAEATDDVSSVMASKVGNVGLFIGDVRLDFMRASSRSGSGFRRRCFLGGGKERVVKGFVKIVTVGEVRFAVFVGFAEEAVIHKVIDEFAEVLGSLDAHGGEDCSGDGAEFLKGVPAHSVAQFHAGDMAGGAAGGFLQGAAGEFENFPDEKVGLGGIGGALDQDLS